VARDEAPDFHAILTAYARRTGRASVVNTSFNMHEEPIIRTASEAVAAFFESHIDSLALGPFLADNPNSTRG
jgi:carbamoyltransferase